MGAVADLTPDGERITLRTNGKNFEWNLERCKQVFGNRFHKGGGEKYWHYPATVATCLRLREVWGEELRITNRLANWYRQVNADTTQHAQLALSKDADLAHVPPAFAAWLRPSQRVGARWIAEPYEGAGLVADTPGLGKTTEMIAGLIEAKVQGPVLVVCPKNAVRLTWGAELARHAPDVPRYLCHGTRERREQELARLHADIAADPHRLRFVVVVSEMLRVEMGLPCRTKPRPQADGTMSEGTVLSGMCPRRRKTPDNSCDLHTEEPVLEKKKLVPVGFSFPPLFSPAALGGGWAAVVLDESHKLLGSLTVVKGNLMGRGLRLLPEREGAYRYAMSGTPFGKGGRVQGMFGSLNWLWPHEYTSFWRWAEQVFDIEEKVVGRKMVRVRKIAGLKGLNPSAPLEDQIKALEGFLRTLGPRILRRTKEEVLPELPPKQYLEVVCPMIPRQAKQYRQLMAAAEVKTRGGVVTANGTLALLTRERQIANGEITQTPSGKPTFTGESGKLERLWEALEERGILDGEPGEKLVVASEMTEFTDVIARQLKEWGVPFYHFDGSTPDKMRDAQVQAWQNNLPLEDRRRRGQRDVEGALPRVFIVNSRAAGVSINLDAADEMHLLDEMWNPEDNEQLEDRIHRASRNHHVRIYYYRTEGTIDYVKAHSVAAKRRAQRLVLDSNRGVDVLRAMMREAFDSTGEEE